jgi:hypothetical protein
MRLKAEEWYAHADDGDNCAAPAVQGSFRGVLGGTFGALKAIIGNRWVLQDPRRRLLQCGWPTPAAIHQAQPLICPPGQGPPLRLSRHVWRKAARLSSESCGRKIEQWINRSKSAEMKRATALSRERASSSNVMTH